MINKIYIQQNKRQYLASKIAASSFVKNGFKKDNIFFIEFDKNESLKAKIGRQYLRNGKIQTFQDDLQSFTLLRFLAPELNNFEDKILVIDPDVFAVSNPSIIFNEIDDNYEMGCTSYNGLLRSEVMIINAKKIRWNFNQIIEDLFNLKVDYSDLINLKFLKNIRVKEISKYYNSHDKIFSDTILLHTTNRITQPWKEGLNIDFQIYKSQFYIIKQYIKKFLGKKFDNSVTQTKYLKHPDAEVIKFIKDLFIYAEKNGLISESEINLSITNGYFSKVFLNNLNK